MESLKKQRKVLRSAFTRAHTAFEAKINDQAITREEKLVSFQLLEAKMTELDLVHAKHSEALFGSDMPEEDIAKEMESDDLYRGQYLSAKVKASDLINPVISANKDEAPKRVTVTENKKVKYPNLEFPKFSGNISEWLPFWSQFKKIHEDKDVLKEDKFQFLLQSSVPGSRASDLIKSFPPTGDNYDKVIKCLKNRFGRDDVIVEFYVRELLGLVMQNAMRESKKEDSKKTPLSQIYDKLEAYIRALDTLGVTTDKCAAMLLPLVESSLPEDVLRAWQRSDRSAPEVNQEGESKDRLDKLLEFLQREVENEERINMALAGFKLSTEQEKAKKQSESKAVSKGTKGESNKDIVSASVLVSTDAKPKPCLFCKGAHDTNECDYARKLTLDERREIVEKEGACYRCLKKGHSVRRCRATIKCAWCLRKHLLIMCSVLASKETAGSKKVEISDKNPIKDHNLTTFCESDVYLPTLQVTAFSENVEKQVRILLDTASHRSYIRAETARELNYIPIGKQRVTHNLFGGITSKNTEHDIFKIRLKSLDSSYMCNFLAMSQTVICGEIPSIRKDNWVKDLRENNIVLTDLEGTNNLVIDILIGADITGKLITGEKLSLGSGLTLLETLLGWTVIGKIKREPKNIDTAVLLTTLYVEQAAVADLWRLDCLGITDPIEKEDKSAHNKRVHEMLISSTRQELDGRYEVELPWKENHTPVPNNYSSAYIRVKKVFEKLKKMGLLDKYTGIFDFWLREGIIEKIENGVIKDCHYLPHRPVFKPGSTTETRPVFDASDGSPSLNQCLETGPNLFELLPASLNRFREGEIGVVADIEKAFLQISVAEKDLDFLRFLWFEGDKLVTYRHKRVVFGLSCSPFLLAGTIELHLQSFLTKIHLYNKISADLIQKLKKSFYADNCVTSVNTQAELESFLEGSKFIMSKGNFNLRLWETTGNFIDKEKTLVLGTLWNKRTDTIAINPSVLTGYDTVPTKVTKRVILSATHKIFDPIGFTCPVSVIPKLIIRDLWLEKVDWDDPVQEIYSTRFLKWQADIKNLDSIEIPRKLGSGVLSLHTFCDASASAYAAVVFSRVETDEGINICLLNARTRVAPKIATIPRLELMAATIGVRLTKMVLESLTRKVDSMTFWSDSTTVLTWISKDNIWGSFVKNRVLEIKSFNVDHNWRHVPGELNPADLPSRGCNPSELIQSKWWQGPGWLYEPISRWPSTDYEIDEQEVLKEVKKSSLVLVASEVKQDFDVLNYFSGYQKLLRFLAIMRRFINNCKLKRRPKTSQAFDRSKIVQEARDFLLTVREVKEAEVKLLIFIQQELFAEKERVSSFKVMLDKDGLYVLKTKIFNLKDSYSFLCPVLLAEKSNLLYLLVRETHENLSHAGTQVIMTALREKYWVISLRKICKKVISSCLICKKQNIKNLECETPPLPLNRIRDAKVFEIIGVDFAGPLYIKGGGKGWICLFTCAVYRALHLELASTLSVAGFLECLRRFIARRGRPKTAYCDNGTNFKGTANAFSKVDWQKIKRSSIAEQIEWYFSPPSAPWWGGWWERLIGIVKVTLRKVLGRAFLTYEALYSILCDTESIVNSRPLTYVSEDPNDLKPLTPSLFLQDIVEIGVPDCDMLCHTKLKGKMRHRQLIREDLRKRFRNEYLSQLLLKSSKKEKRALKVGEVVLIGDSQSQKRIDWPLGRIEKMIVSPDGNCRVVMVKTKNGVLKRPIQRIFPLEITQGESENIDLNSKLSVTKKCNKTKDSPEKKVNSKNNAPIATEVVTRSGRISKKPDRLSLS